MCGIAGKIDHRGYDNRALVGRMTERLARRGPDSSGVLAVGAATLGHRRLSVIDTRSVADQPMADAIGRFHIVFNGEIYNFREIRDALEREGARFRTLSDTEVILAAYARWGTDCLARFNGMFAFALWDARDGVLFLARDRLGEKPLYYARVPGGTVFASQLDAVCEDTDIERRIDAGVLGRFLDCNYVWGPDAIVAGVKRLPPAHYLLLTRDGGTPAPVRYWSAAPYFAEAKTARDPHEAAEELAALLDDATRLRLISDVPVGALLSGGVDSSAVVASMTRASLGSVETFCMGFDDARFDERAPAARIAAHLSTRHFASTASGGAEAAMACMAAWDEPFADSSMLPTYELARFARARVTVALSGDGGDELFAGYPTYAADKLKAATDWIPNFVDAPAKAVLRAFVKPSFGKVAWDEKLERFLDARTGDFATAHAGWRRIRSRDEKCRLLRHDWRDAVETDAGDAVRPYADEIGEASSLDRALYADLSTWLPDCVLTKVDRATMAWGLESRAPFLDHRVVEFAARLPVELKMRGMSGKRILRDSQRSRLPPETLNRAKAGFGSPVAHWVRAWRDDPAIGDAKALAGDEFEPAAIETLWRDHLDGRADNGLRLFGLVAFRAWARRAGLG